jgi:hypothetical protein
MLLFKILFKTSFANGKQLLLLLSIDILNKISSKKREIRIRLKIKHK